MILDTQRVVTELSYRDIVPVEDAAGTRICCLRGRIWITESGSAEDIVLETGQWYVISRSGVALVQALRASLVGLRAPASRLARGGLATWVERLCSQGAARPAGRHPTIAQPRGMGL